MSSGTPTPDPAPGRPSEGNAAADAADPYRKVLEKAEKGVSDADAAGSDAKAREREQAALDNVREKYDLPVGGQPHPEQPATPLPAGPNDLGRKNSTPP